MLASLLYVMGISQVPASNQLRASRRQSPPKKRKLHSADAPKPSVHNQDGDEGDAVPPPTPIRVIQRVGAHLGIPSEKITKEKLMARPSTSSGSASTSDDV